MISCEIRVIRAIRGQIRCRKNKDLHPAPQAHRALDLVDIERNGAIRLVDEIHRTQRQGLESDFGTPLGQRRDHQSVGEGRGLPEGQALVADRVQRRLGLLLRRPAARRRAKNRVLTPP